ncbi:hypothetical protein FRX31_027628 [Thalictrum thalictroides]|uniref:Uncharacterized protein n=1 Tax=Thalictrum thalictroides TaxID=46969 RepID=A0A7J6VCF8_THATH|nr:hypothetical protein FRX31_027628 [Thalictrum thalictroides]
MPCQVQIQSSLRFSSKETTLNFLLFLRIQAYIFSGTILLISIFGIFTLQFIHSYLCSNSSGKFYIE